MVALGRYPFTYDGVDDADPTKPGHEVEDFFTRKLVAVEFQILSRDYRKTSSFKPLFDYSLRMQSVYLVQGLQGPPREAVRPSTRVFLPGMK